MTKNLLTEKGAMLLDLVTILYVSWSSKIEWGFKKCFGLWTYFKTCRRIFFYNNVFTKKKYNQKYISAIVQIAGWKGIC